MNMVVNIIAPRLRAFIIAYPAVAARASELSARYDAWNAALRSPLWQPKKDDK